MCIQTAPFRRTSKAPHSPSVRKSTKLPIGKPNLAYTNNTNTAAPIAPITPILTKSTENPLNHPRSPKKPKKSVSFYSLVLVQPVLHLNKYTDREISDCWWTAEDAKQTKAEIADALLRVRDGQFCGCIRGLECHMQKLRRHRRRAAILQSVREEQTSQIEQAKADDKIVVYYDSNRFREALKKHSRSSRIQARAMGKIDELAAAEAEIDQQVTRAVATATKRLARRRWSTRSDNDNDNVSPKANNKASASVPPCIYI